MVLRQARLLARLTASEPRLVRLCAPAGFGKSTLARLFAARFEVHAICDCAGIASAREFASRVLAALADEVPGEAAIAAVRLRLHATEADEGAWSRALLEAWKSHRTERSLLILDHADALESCAGAVEMLGDLLACRPPERIVLITSRSPVPLRIGHFVAPHQTVTLSRDELRFEPDEAASLFDGTDLSPRTVARIMRIADGWPVALMLLARFAHYEANFEGLLDRLEGLSSRELYEHLGNEVLSALTPEMMSVLVAAAAIPGATLEDISAATGIRHALLIVEGLRRLPEFISGDAGVCHTHPLLVAALRANRTPEMATTLARAAAENERLGNFVRAAELFHVCGHDAAAAAALDRLPLASLQRPGHVLVDAIARIAVPALCERPNLWIALLGYRRQHLDASRLRDEAARLLEGLAPDAPPTLRRRLRVRLAMLAQELRRLTEARQLIETGDPPGTFEEEPEEQRLALMTSALIAAKQGRFAEADRCVEEADVIQGARHLRFDAERAEIAIERARTLGDWQGLLAMSEEALHAAQRSGVTARIVAAGRAVADAAWYCNDDGRCVAIRQMLDDCGDAESRTLAELVAAARAGTTVRASARTLAGVCWHAALVTTDLERAKELFDRAIENSDELEDGFMRVAIRATATLLLPSRRRRLLEARTIAQRIESPPLQASLELLIEAPAPADYGIFNYLAARVARSPLKVRQDVLCVNVVRGDVRRGSEALHVSDRGFELLAALALLPPQTLKEDLAAAIWPGLDAEAALNALKMCVSRTRAQVADKEAIVSTKRGYALNDRVSVDLRDLEHLVRSARAAEGLAQATRRRLEEWLAHLDAARRPHSSGWTWFTPYSGRLEDLREEVRLVLARDVFVRDPAAI